LAFVLTVALPSLVCAQEQISPGRIFEEAWGIFDTNYPYFGHRGIDWDAVYRIYRPQVTEQSTDDELFGVIRSMLSLLNDGHVNLSNGRDRFNAGITNDLKMKDFSEELVRTRYLKPGCGARQDSNLVYGWLTDGIGYLRIRGWKQKFQVGAILDSILADLGSARAIIIDVRANTGGNAFAAEAIADRFADRKRLFAKNFPKGGPGHDALLPPRYAYVEPAGPAQFTGPIVILQHRFSESATEGFVLAMRVLPHATTIGDFTSGCFGNYYPDKLANGWTVSMAWSYEVDQNDQCWVGIGLPPDLHVINSQDDIDSGQDRVLEFAIRLIETGGHFGREVPGSLDDMRESLFERLVQTADSDGVAAAVAESKRLQSDRPGDFYFSPQECMNGSQVLFESGRLDVLIAIMEMAKDTWPSAISFPWVLGMAYTQQGRLDKAADAYQLIADREAYFPWDKASVEQARRFLADDK
jgi:hypothetical protein